MALDQLAARLATAGAELTAAAGTLSSHDPGADAFGAGADGRLGALGRELHGAYLGALDARVREAVAHGARLSATAEDVARAASGYVAADDASRARFGRPGE
jgi:hypothetical protein